MYRIKTARISRDIDGVQYGPGEWKDCSKCWKALPIANFTKSSRSEDGHKPYCRDCAKKARAKRKMTDLTLSSGPNHWATEKGAAAIAKETGLKVDRYYDADSQRAKVYNADRGIDRLLGSKSMTEAEIVAFYAKVCADYGRTPPKVTFAKTGNVSWASKLEIKLTGVYGKRTMVVIHELAHFLDLSDVEGHGAPYVGIYIELIDRYTDVTADQAADVFRANKVRFVR